MGAERKGHGQERDQALQQASPQSLAEIILSEPVAKAIRKELRSKTGHRLEEDAIVSLLKETVTYTRVRIALEAFRLDRG